MKLKTSIFLLLTFTMSLVGAQDEPKKVELKIGVSFYKEFTSGYSQFDKMPNLNTEINYIFSNYIKSGIYAGASYFKNTRFINPNSTLYGELESKGSFAIYYGTNFNLNLLQFIVDTENLKPELYAISRIGGRFIPAPDDYFIRGNDFIWAGGIGTSYNFNKKTGAFIESTYGNNYYDRGFSVSLIDKIDVRYGILLRF